MISVEDIKISFFVLKYANATQRAPIGFPYFLILQKK